MNLTTAAVEMNKCGQTYRDSICTGIPNLPRLIRWVNLAWLFEYYRIVSVPEANRSRVRMLERCPSFPLAAAWPVNEDLDEGKVKRRKNGARS